MSIYKKLNSIGDFYSFNSIGDRNRLFFSTLYPLLKRPVTKDYYITGREKIDFLCSWPSLNSYLK